MIIPKKSLGQNFLKDRNICKKIIGLTKIKDENILEIGPGYGVLTDEILTQNPKKLILIEKDKLLSELLKKKYRNEKNVSIINYDILFFDLNKLKNFKIISNLPYNISTKIILKVLKNHKKFLELIVMIQKEVGEKFDYKNKINKYNFYSKLFSNYHICFDVSNNVFYPKPKITSSVVKFEIKNRNIDIEKLDKFSKIIFNQKRKKISNKFELFKLSNDNKLDKRIEELTFEEVLGIYNSF